MATSAAELQGRIYQILQSVIVPEHVNLLFDQEAMSKYWIPALTHKSISGNNYEDFEFIGDLHLGPQFIKYLQSRFETRLTPVQGTYFLTVYMSKKYQAKLSEKLGLDKLVNYDPSTKLVTSIKEDIFESFCGALTCLVDERILNGLGDIYLYNFLIHLFNPVELSLSEVSRDSKSKLKELYDKKGWGEVKYIIENSDRIDRSGQKITILSQTGHSLGVGYGRQTEAEQEAAQQALNELSQKGININTVQQEQIESKLRNDANYQAAHRQVTLAMNKLNDIAKQKGKVQFTTFKIVHSPVPNNKDLVTYSLEFGYPDGDQIKWKPLAQETGNKSTTRQIQLMNNFSSRVLSS